MALVLLNPALSVVGTASMMRERDNENSALRRTIDKRNRKVFGEYSPSVL